ncbi:GNAT family N-acetyltransferase [Hydrogenophaga intermedia]|uniref:Gnat family protein n=1 Tax=Hydrogenophaga intermedia TaxID=65786 RepID=A0A1L1PI43_HYDIT|nr:N-acetyltransferase [Hydrogenophaga intermedia]TMU73402.1 N-acetyltransferase [Hydrogenophaga intermedia]CDN89662.1 Gnat family protein [Hydrogenophaga intermedia]
MQLRPEQPPDAPAIGSLIAKAFADNPHSGGTEPAIVRELRAAGALTISLVAVDETGHVVGHIAFSPESIAGGGGRWYGLGPISVLPALQGTGIGGSLMTDGLARLKALGAEGCVVLGEPAYYGRWGFAVREGLVYPGVPPEYFMALAFDGGVPRGEVAYHAAFAATT